MHTPPRRLSPVLLVIAILALDLAVRLHDGTYSPGALAVLTLALAAMALAAVLPWRGSTKLLLATPLLLQFSLHCLVPPTIVATLSPGSLGVLSLAVAIGTLAALVSIWAPSRFQAALVIGVIVVGALAWALSLVATRTVYNDVIAFHREASAALLDGRNPYAMTMPNIYGEGTKFYSPGMVVDGRVQYAYPYPPLSLLLTLGGYVLGDVRWTLLIAGVATAAMLAAIARSPTLLLPPLPPGEGGGEGARGVEPFTHSQDVSSPTFPALPGAAIAALFLFAPHAFYVTPFAYTDGFVAAAFALVVFAAMRSPRLLPIALGLFLATKQYSIILIPILPLLLPGRWTIRSLWSLLWPAVLIASALTLPPLLLDARRYLNALLFVQMRQPFRPDSLGYLSWLMAGRSAQPSALATVIGFAALIPAILFALWRFPRTPAGFAAAAAFVYTVFFAFGRQAFANYYFFVTAALCCALAASASNPSPRALRSLRSSLDA